MTSGFVSGGLLKGLAVRVLFFLSLALMPIGLIAIVQTWEISKQNQTSAELSLLAVTEQASSAERRVLQEAFGAADALSAMVRLFVDDPAECSEVLRQYRNETRNYEVIGFVWMDGRMECSSSGDVGDLSDRAWFRAAKENGTRGASSIDVGAVSGKAVTVVHVPVENGEELVGFLAISISESLIQAEEEPRLSLTPLAMVTFNAEGDVLTSERGMDVSGVEMPQNIALSVFAGTESKVFFAENSDGVNRAYAVLPIVPDTVYAMSVWPEDTPFLQMNLMTRLSTLLPVAMWAASLIVAFWALNRLAISHIRKLGRQMRRFALSRTLPRDTLAPSIPTELAEMETAFVAMAESILRDEATLEDSLREKNILLKEVHHRVKNNLQLISSIMNMQIRQAKTADARFVLRRLQERILSLATVHKNLYQDDNLVRVDAKTLLNEVVGQLLKVGLGPKSHVEITLDFERISIDADDAAPLTLLTSEAITNALKYLPQSSPNAHLSATLRQTDTELAQLTVSNTIGEGAAEPGTGLGSRLIEAFARQLNGHVEIESDETNYALKVTFHVPKAAKQVYDY
ncbi:putative sensor histidine kinase pdtaS [Sulfitobacter sp. THAF37]|uniref:sensor histidine kinase n=1 Tax=Sulfitobacter sp. THAF37 TaxID=2587855 RepID=UPI0012692A0A|nr:histidine kinase dimerization/phosphoacceptor domain -containing protein [Sulfitobacter sp. THAF37]QFT58137.1 putative sensor histidine kinase pdtaS [Sulfitobacter sp. THAF37]